MQTTLIATVLNEADNIFSYLDSLRKQTVKPTEIIIVDAGSTDGTVPIIHSFKDELNIKVIIKKGCTISEAENIAIKKAKYPIIVGGCAGIYMPKNWLENLLKGFDKNTDIVSGVYKIVGKTHLQSSISDVMQYGLLPDINKATNNFNPSNRSLAYRKKVWKKLGKYPEQLNRSDDTWFDIEARKAGFKFKINKKAVVYWEARKNLKELFKYSYLDVKSDVRNGIKEEHYIRYSIDLFLILISMVTAILHPMLFYFILSLNLAYLSYYSIRVALTNGKFYRLPTYFIILIVIMFSIFSGLIGGSFNGKSN